MTSIQAFDYKETKYEENEDKLPFRIMEMVKEKLEPLSADEI